MARRLTLVIAAVGALAAACGESVGYDVDGLEAQIPAAVLPEAPELVTAVECADAVPLDATAVACTLVVVDTSTSVDARIADDGTVRADLPLTVIEVADVAADIADRVTADLGVETTVVCEGPVLRVVEAGATIRCTATAPDGSTRSLVAELTGDEGDFTVSIGD